MTRTNQTILSLIVLVFSLLTIACQTAPAAVSQQPIPQEVIGQQPAAAQPASAAPASTDRTAESQALLATIVRLEIQGAGISHGTVMSGRYLVTHNHFPFDMTAISDSYPAEFKTFSLYRADGSPLIDRSRLTNLNVVVAEKEMLVLDFGTLGEQGFFDFLGIPSAEFGSADGLTAGMEVAQLNWNEETAWIQWVTVRAAGAQEGSPAFILDSALTAGASGGGIFWNGRHVANNWSNNVLIDESSNAVIDAYSVIAPNSDFWRSPSLMQSDPAVNSNGQMPTTADESEEIAVDKGL